MKSYFDKTFWKLSLGFLTILAFSFLCIMMLRVYESNRPDNLTVIANTDNTDSN